MASRRTDKDSGKILSLVLGVVAIIPFSLFIWIHFRRLRNAHPDTETSQRVYDIGEFLDAVPICGGLVVFLYFMIPVPSFIVQFIIWRLIDFLSYFSSGLTGFVSPSAVALIGNVSQVPIFGFIIWLIYQYSKRLAVKYQGVIADPATGILIIPFDWTNQGIDDWLKLRPLRRLGEVEKIALRDISRITREAGKKLHIHGSFGSREISFTNKQKRDECLAMITQFSRGRILFDVGN